MTTEILHVVGARPNFMKAAPVIAALDRLAADQYLVHTGQHYDETLSRIFFEELELPRPDVDLEVGSGTHAVQTAALLTRLETVFSSRRPSLVVVYGDVNSTLAAALVAAKLHIPIAHVEAGLRSFDRSMPEEVNRVVTDALSDLHLVTSEEAIDHLQNEGARAGSIHMVGNPMIDTLLRFRDAVDPESVRTELGIPEAYGVVTLHRPSNVDDPDVAGGLVSALHSIASDLPLVFPIHPRGREALAAAGLGSSPGVAVVDPLPYTRFLALMMEARLVLTDSGGIQEETTVLGVPCLTLRHNTERPITITHGTNTLVGTDPDTIVTTARQRLADGDRTPRTPPLWDGSAGDRIARIVVDSIATGFTEDSG
jgi:UDP-N-acetylglucosamine 2-epimerase (non-hydrolysing)